jgi:hypothetical protein
MNTSSIGTFAEQAMAFMRYAMRSERMAAAGLLFGNVSEYVNIGEPMGVGLGLCVWLAFSVCVLTATRSVKSRIDFIYHSHNVS